MKKVLVIDDDKDVLDVMREALEYGGYNVQTTETSDDVFSLIASFQPQLVLIDFMLHGANGGEICHQIKTDRRTPQLPVVIVSASPVCFCRWVTTAVMGLFQSHLI